VLEGIASGTAHILDTYRDVGAEPSMVLAVGGGTRNDVWLQATSDLGHVSQVLRKRTIGASYGDAFLAAVATGSTTPDAIDDWNPTTRTVSPHEVPAYAHQYPLWKALYERTSDIAHALTGGPA
jgi:xylulokinase